MPFKIPISEEDFIMRKLNLQLAPCRPQLAAVVVLVGILFTGCATSAPVTQTTSVVSDNKTCRTSSDNTVADMPGVIANFTIEGDDPTGVIVSFVGSWSKPTDSPAAGAFIFLEVDGSRVDITSTNGGVLASPGTATDVSSGTHGFNFVTDPIAPGNHVAKIRWADNLLNGTGTICVTERSMVIFHN